MIFKTFKKGTPSDDYWDMALIKNLPTYHKALGDENCEIVVVPARQNAERVKEVNRFLSGFHGVVLILTGDEENVFPVDKIEHENIRIWQMTPVKEFKRVDRYLPNGYTPHTKLLEEFETEYMAKEMEWFFSGQVTHTERKKLADTLQTMENGLFNKSSGFTQGLEKREYIRNMAMAKVVPCPAGPITPDTFRFYEALEAGAVPLILDKHRGYFDKVFGDNPIRSIEDWDEFPAHIRWYIDTYPHYNNVMGSWWSLEKNKIFKNLMNDFQDIGGAVERSEILTIIPTSPTPFHPSTKAIEEVINSVVERLPNSEVLILADGVRAEQEKYRGAYEEYLKRLIYLVTHRYKNTSIRIFDEHKHQAGMMRAIINEVEQPYILFVEHDTPLCEFIPFDHLKNAIRNGITNFIRLHHEALILDVHKHLMLNEIEFQGLTLVETAQWSQRPHLASTEFYRKCLDNFTVDSRTMIEDKMFGVVQDAFRQQGRAGWNNYKLTIYKPEGDMKRSYHLDTRGKEPKFEMKF